MGGIESHFNSLLVEGKAEEAIKLWNENFELQAKHQPNAQIKASPHRDTPLHCTVRWEMKALLQEFLSRGGDPFVMNANGETPLHLICRASKLSSRRSKKRADSLRMMLDRVPSEEAFEVIKSMSYLERGQSLKESSGSFVNGDKKKFFESISMSFGGHSSKVESVVDRDAHHLGIQDNYRNTPLHLAATSGLLECVELLVAHNAPLFVHNLDGQTPCDVAWKSNQIVIAKQLESKMVLDSDHGQDDSHSSPAAVKRTRNMTFHDTKTLKELKQSTISSIAQKLQISDFSAQALLTTYGWSKELLEEEWESDRGAACEKAGLSLHSIMLSNGRDISPGPLNSLTLHDCEICENVIELNQKIRIPCQHTFCKDCWRTYIEGQINEGGGKEIRCPGFQCFQLVPESIISKLISDTQMNKYTDLTLKKFVDSSGDIRWCPYPDCNYAICKESKKKEEEKGGGASPSVNGGVAMGGASPSTSIKLTPGENVECGQGHGFCWNCLKDPHEPCSCEVWEKWKNTVLTNMSEEDKTNVTKEAQANAKWIVRNTKPCPNCKSPIQKNEGCNHMTCKTCRHDFCWVCQDPWRLHSHRTGGYFTCNRWNAQTKAEKETEKSKKVLEKEYVERAYEEMETQHRKFEHFHDRYNNHLQSLAIEITLLQQSQAKLREMERIGNALDKKVALVRAKRALEDQKGIDEAQFADVACRSFPHLKGNFLDDIFRALLHARRILAASYCIGYFLPADKKEALQAHEALQGKLEDAVEILSQMVNRDYLLTPQQNMSSAAHSVEFLCEEYLVEMQEVATLAGRVVMGIEDEEERQERERERRERERVRPVSPPTLEELLFLENFIRLMDGNGRLHIFVPPVHPAAQEDT